MLVNCLSLSHVSFIAGENTVVGLQELLCAVYTHAMLLNCLCMPAF